MSIQGGPYIGWSNLLGPLFLNFNTTLMCDISLESAGKIENGYEYWLNCKTYSHQSQKFLHRKRKND
jgi:hypothetical protein